MNNISGGLDAVVAWKKKISLANEFLLQSVEAIGKVAWREVGKV